MLQFSSESEVQSRSGAPVAARLKFFSRACRLAALYLLLPIGLASRGTCMAKDEAPSTAASAQNDRAVASSPSAETRKVLRHAVFFRFKATSSEREIQDVIRAFEELPKKIPAIVDFSWGVNNSPEKLDDGFTHCFLITFQDEAGREEYLPHAAHLKFVTMVKPHLEKVFVVDYWGDASRAASERSLKHAVFFQFKEDASAEQIKRVEQAFAELPAKISTIVDFEWGINNSPEKHDQGFTHCFMVTFANEDGRAVYLPHPDHQAFVDVLKPVLAKARVLDFWTGE